MGALILLIDDEEDLVQSVAYALEKEGLSVRTAGDGAGALAAAAQLPLPDLILLDLMLPDTSGLDVCRELRRREATRDVPIIMVTARGEEIDRVVGFEVGADDYVVKPFSPRELVLRIKAVLRRKAPSDVSSDGQLSFGRLRIDEAAHRVWVDEEERTLTALEFKLLVTLHARKGRVQSRDTLLADVWGYSADVTTRTVDTHIKRVREKLGAAGAYIETVRGAGYRFASSPPGVSQDSA